MKIAIIDDDNLVVLSLKTIIESTGKAEVVAVGNSGEEAISIYKEKSPDVMLMDIRMEGMTGLQAGEKILEIDKNAKLLYLSTFADDEYIVKALNMGAKGYILKQDFEGIVPALEAVMKGQRVFGENVINKLPVLNENKEKFNFKAFDINEKEQEIIEYVALGYSNKEISSELYLSEGTVRNYLSVILDKLNLRDRTQLAVFYYTKIKI